VRPRAFAAIVVPALVGAVASLAPRAAAFQPPRIPADGSALRDVAVTGAGPRPAARATASDRAPGAQGSGFAEESVTIPIFGRVTVYRPRPAQRTRGAVLFVSGDGGWNLGVVDMARRTAGRALVVGLPLPAWRKAAEAHPQRCWFPAGELESIAQTVEKMYALPRYLKPILVGYSSGATLVYGALAQAPAEAFAGAVSLGFCPDLEVARRMCSNGAWKPTYDTQKRNSLLPPRTDLAPRAGGTARWTVLQGEIDQVCDPAAVGRFAAQVPAARVVSLPHVGHGFSVPRNWGTAYDEAIDSLLDPVSAWEPPPAGPGRGARSRSPSDVEKRLEELDLPLQVQWPEGARDAIIFVSGDGGWAELDQEVTAHLVKRGVGVVGWNSLRYFWERRSPEEFRADLVRVVEAVPRDVRLFAGGYSFGAEVIPPVLASAPVGAADPLSRIAGLVLLAPGAYATFEVSPLDWIRGGSAPTSHPVAPAIEAARGRPTLCLVPADGSDSGCPDRPVAGVTRMVLPGSHHFDGDFERLAERIVEFLGSKGVGDPESEIRGRSLAGGR